MGWKVVLRAVGDSRRSNKAEVGRNSALELWVRSGRCLLDGWGGGSDVGGGGAGGGWCLYRSGTPRGTGLRVSL